MSVEYSSNSKQIKMPYNVSFGLIYNHRDSLLFTGLDQKTGQKMCLYNVRVIGMMFEKRLQKMLEDKTTETLFSWISEVCSLYISSFVNAHVMNAQHRDEGAAERTTRQIVRGFWDRLTSGPELKYVLDSIRDPVPHQK